MSVELEESRLTKDIVRDIPAFPPVVLRVLDLLSGDHPDLIPLSREIGSDATLSAQLLRVANSPLYGLVAQVDSIHRAVITLGFMQVQSLVMNVATSNYMRGALQTQAMQKCWRHTLASALLCREMGRAAGLPQDRAYSFGLLHDIGRLGLLVAYPNEYDKLLRVADRDAVSLLDLEKRRFGMDHCEIGRRLVEEWKLPPDFCVIAGRHHDSPSGAPLDALSMVHFACQLADTLGYAVVAPLKEVTYEEIREQLPPAVRNDFAESREALLEMLDREIGQDPIGTEAPESTGFNAGDASTLIEARDEQDEEDEPTSAAIMPEPSFASLERSARGGINLLLVAAMILLVLVAGAFCLWKA